MTAELAIQAVKNAALNTNRLNGIILHSDFGSQYTSKLFENHLIKNGMKHSFSRKGNPYVNLARMSNVYFWYCFMASLKVPSPLVTASSKRSSGNRIFFFE